MSKIVATVSLWSAVLAARDNRDFELERQLCEQMVVTDQAKRSRCSRRLEELSKLQDRDGYFSCLKQLSLVRAQHSSLPTGTQSELVKEIYHSKNCSYDLKQSALLWLLSEAYKTQNTLASITLFENSNNPNEASKRAAAKLYAQLGQLEQAEALWPTSDAAREGPAEAKRRSRREQLGQLSIACLSVFLLLSLPFVNSGWQKVKPSKRLWKGLGAVLLSCALLSVLRSPSSLSLWLCLGPSWAAVILLSGLVQSDAPSWAARTCAWLAALSCAACTWLWASYFGVSSWIY